MEGRFGRELEAESDLACDLFNKVDALLGYEDAVEKYCSIVRRGANAMDILIKQGGGILHHSDSVKYFDAVKHKTPRLIRSGTWQFMSTAILEDPTETQSIQGDLESFIWVVLYHVLRHMTHSMSVKGLEKNIRNIFEQTEEHIPGQPDCGGQGKRKLVTTSMPLTMNFKIHQNEPLTTLVHVFLLVLGDHYRYLADVVYEMQRVALASKISADEAVRIVFADPALIIRHKHNFRDHGHMETVFQEALRQASWPVSDGTQDSLLRIPSFFPS